MDAAKYRALCRAIDRAEELQERITDFAKPPGDRFTRLQNLVRDVFAFADEVGADRPAVDAEHDQQSTVLRGLLTFVNNQIGSLTAEHETETRGR